MSALERRATQALESSQPGHGPGAHDPCSHLANAYRIVDRLGDALMFVEGLGWHVWGPPWRADELAAHRRVHGLGAIVADEAAELARWVADAPNKAERELREQTMARRFKWAGTSESAPCIEASLRMAATLLACKANALDADPMLLGTPSGVLDLRTGKHRPHCHDDRITKVAGCDFDARADAPTWTRFLGEIFADDSELIDYVQRLAGYTLSGMRGEHLLPILWGSGANGKSTYLAAMQAMLGDYASSAAPGLLLQRTGNDHPTGLADLQGRRLVVVSETGEAGRLNEEQAKLLTGGDTITARRMRMDFYTFKPTHQLMLQTNHRPRVTGTDEGVWRRLRLIPFAVTIPAAKRDPKLTEKLAGELPGILRWAFEGWQRYVAQGFNEPAAVRLATADYRVASDQFGAFLSETCIIDHRLTTTAGALYAAYVDWCEVAGERPRSQRDFGLRLSERGFEQGRTGKARRWHGMGLAESVASDGSDPFSALTPTRDKNIAGYSDFGTNPSHPTHASEAYRLARDGE